MRVSNTFSPRWCRRCWKHKLRKQLKKIDEPDSLTYALILELEQADEAMMQWMADFGTFRQMAKEKDEVKIQYLINEKEKIQNLLNKDQVDDEDYELIIVAVRKSNAVDQVKDEAKAFTDKAVTYLDAFDQSPVRDDLVALNRFLINRYY